jgi:prefoldin subunit 5
MSEDKEVKDAKEAIEMLNKNRKSIREQSEKMAFKLKCLSHPSKNKR